MEYTLPFVTVSLRDYTFSSVKRRCEKDSKGMAMSSERPVNLDLTTFHFPVTAIASILHRVCGVILFLEVSS